MGAADNNQTSIFILFPCHEDILYKLFSTTYLKAALSQNCLRTFTFFVIYRSIDVVVFHSRTACLLFKIFPRHHLAVLRLTLPDSLFGSNFEQVSNNHQQQQALPGSEKRLKIKTGTMMVKEKGTRRKESSRDNS